uniref:Uncharacterized protein n=1 Tax=Quercus lobata TaxID=97700 RepID=A0A7N2LZD5_QUELO
MPIYLRWFTGLFGIDGIKLGQRKRSTPLTDYMKWQNNILQNSTKLDLPRSKKIRAQRPRWKPPDQGNVKTNFDEAVFEDINSASIGVVVRDDRGELLAALAKRILMPDSVLVLETLVA